jgi:hypothetical protein
MTSTFGRYSELLEDARVSLKTRAMCGRLITADARFATMVSILHKFGHKDGPLTTREWRSLCVEGEQVHENFDQAWARFVQEFSEDDWNEVDGTLCEMIETAITRLDQLVARFPNEELLIDW